MNDTRPIHEIPDVLEAVHVYKARLEVEGLILPKFVRLTQTEWFFILSKFPSDTVVADAYASIGIPGGRRILSIPVHITTQRTIDRLGRFEE